MSRGTDYTLYKVCDEAAVINEELIVDNVKAMLPYSEGVTWERNVDAVFPLWYDELKYERDEKTGMFNVPDKYNGKYIRKSDGVLLEKIASWTFNSTSIFLMDEIFAIDGHPGAEIISPETASEYVKAVDFLEHHALKHGKDAQFVSYMTRNNFILKNFKDNGYFPLPTDVEMEDQIDNITAVRDILQAFLIFLSSDSSDGYSENNEPRYILTVGHWG